jgi:hypothetical protein
MCEIDGACNRHVEMRNTYKILVGRPEGKRPLRRPGQGRVRLCTGLRGSGQGQEAGCCEHALHKWRESLEQLSNYQLLKKNRAPCNLVSSFRLKQENKLATSEWDLRFHGDKCTVWSPYLPPTAVFKFPILLIIN